MFGGLFNRSRPRLALVAKKAKKKKKINVKPDGPLIPYIPAQFVKDTVDLFKNQTRVKALTDFIFSPADSKETPEDRREYEEKVNEFKETHNAYCRAFRKHEERADTLMWEAIKKLPHDFYDEAVQSNNEPLPDELQFHALYRKQIFESLSELEQTKLQAFHNLMHLRYPHREVKKKKPELFWAPETQLLARQKEAALAMKKKK